MAGIAVDGFGNVFVTDHYNHRVQKFRADLGVRDLSGLPDSPVIEWYSESGKTYQVWLSEDCLTWVSASGIQAGTETGVTFWTDDGLHALGPPTQAPRRFYRVFQLK